MPVLSDGPSRLAVVTVSGALDLSLDYRVSFSHYQLASCSLVQQQNIVLLLIYVFKVPHTTGTSTIALSH